MLQMAENGFLDVATMNTTTYTQPSLQLMVMQILHLVQQNRFLLQQIHDSGSHNQTLVLLQKLYEINKSCQLFETEVNNKKNENQLEKYKNEIISLEEKLQSETLQNELLNSELLELKTKINTDRSECKVEKAEYEEKQQQMESENEHLKVLAKQSKEINKRYTLNKAVQKNDIEKVTILLEAGLSTETVDSVGWRSLHNASAYGYLEIFKLLVKHGANLTARTDNKFGSSCMDIAAINGQTKIIQYLLELGMSVHLRNKCGQTALGGAAWNGHYDAAKLLLENGADVNARNINQDMRSPLHSAVHRGHSQVAGLLLNYGADIESRDNDGKTPLIWAAWTGKLEAAKLLIEHGANVHATDKWGKTAKQTAINGGFNELAKFLESDEK